MPFTTLKRNVIGACVVIFSLTGTAHAQITIFVTDTSDSGTGTLRAAISQANLTLPPSTITIEFRLPDDQAVGGVWTIRPKSMLTTITRDRVTIDGSTQKGASCGILNKGNPHVLKVVLDGSLASPGESGLNVAASANWTGIAGLAIHSFPQNGIRSEGTNTVIGCNYIGTDVTGIIKQGNGSRGIAFHSRGAIVINSLISGNDTDGVIIWGNSVAVQGNLIGTDVTGSTAIANGSSGVAILGDSVQVGGTLDADRNIISGNQNGISTNDGVQECSIEGNYVGLDLSGTSAIPNEIGIYLLSKCTVGTGTTAGMNIVSGNTSTGINVSSFSVGALIQGNRVGTNRAGSAAVPNGLDGIRSVDSTRVIGNLISGNISVGLSITGVANVVDRNLVGTNHAGTSAIPNTLDGIGISGSGTHVGSGQANLVSGNGRTGILVWTVDSVVIENNLIGVTISGTSALGNAVNGVSDFGASTTIRNNVISGNGGHGVDIVEPGSAVLEGNFIGTDVGGTLDLGNGIDGVSVVRTATIGSLSSTDGNVIAFNTRNGVTILTGPVSVLGNQIFANDDLGIDLDPAGVTLNDPADLDAGANDLQNFPEIEPIVTDGLTPVGVSFSLWSTAADSFRIEFFRSPLPDDVGYGEGQVFVRAIGIRTDVNGLFSSSEIFSTVELPLGWWLTATATRIEPSGDSGPTSEFSLAMQALDVPLWAGRLFLEGPYAGGGLMHLHPGYDPFISTIQPYSDPLYDGTLLEYDSFVQVPIPAEAVDWLILSLRSGTSEATEVVRRPAFLELDGDILNPDGSWPYAFPNVPLGAYHVVACQRNHLCAMSDTLVDMTSGLAEHDFTAGAAYTLGPAAQKVLSDGPHGLFAGNAVPDPYVQALDFDVYLAQTLSGATGYQTADFNLDGNVQALDFNLYIANTLAGASSQVP